MKYSHIFAAFFCFFTFSAYAGDITDEIVRSDKYLSNVKGMIELEQSEINTIRNQKEKRAKELKKAEIELNYHKNIASKIQKKIKKTEDDIKYIEYRQAKLLEKQESLKNDIRDANVYLSGAGETELLEALIMANELKELTAGMQIMSRVNSRLFEMAEELSEVSENLEKSKNELINSKAVLADTYSEKKENLKKYEANKLMVKQMLKLVSEDEKIKKEYVALLEEKQQELEKKIEELELKQIKQGEQHKFDGLGKIFSQMSGKLPWPVSGNITEKFGTKKVEGFKGVIHKKGIKIQPYHTQVSSIYDGVVIHTDTAWGLGWFVIVEHFGGYYSLYANLNEIIVFKDQKVHTGETLGTIDIDHEANTPYLYFEIRFHDKAVDPEKWITS